MPEPEQPRDPEGGLDAYVRQLNENSMRKPGVEGLRYACPCCGYLTLGERGGFEICSVCSWEDDGQDEHDADSVRGGPNHELSLSQARANFRAYGACHPRHRGDVRAPEPQEQPPDPRP